MDFPFTKPQAMRRLAADHGGKTGGRQEDTTGAQSLRRGLQVMKLLAGGPLKGMRPVDIASELNLSYPTAYRILRALEMEGMVQRVHGSRRFISGAEAAWIGLSASQRYPIASAAAPILNHISREHGETVLLSVKSGDHSVCVSHRAGSHLRQVTAAIVGKRMPMTVSPTGRTMLAFMPDADCMRMMAANRPVAGSDMDLAGIRARGYLRCDGITVRDTEVLAVPIFDAGGMPIAAIGTVSTSSRMADKRVPALLRSMQAAARTIADELLARYAAENRGAADIRHGVRM